MGLENQPDHHGESLANWMLRPNLGDIFYCLKNWGPVRVFRLINLRNHLSRYNFSIKEGEVDGKRVLDVACGPGYGSDMIAKAGANETAGVEIRKVALEEATACGLRKDNCYFFQADGQNLPFANNSFDLVVSFETIEHVENDRQFIEETRRVCDDNGTWIFSTPNRDYARPEKTINDRPDNEHHVREYSTNELEILLSNYFEEVCLFGQRINGYPDMSCSPVRWARKLSHVFWIDRFTAVRPIEEFNRNNKNPVGYEGLATIVAVCRGKKVVANN